LTSFRISSISIRWKRPRFIRSSLENKMTRELLKELIKKSCIAFPSDQLKVVSKRGQSPRWLLDLRPLLLQSDTLAYISGTFWDRFENLYPFQVCARELTAVPLLGAIIAEGQRRGRDVTGVVIRKSRKKTGLQKLIEGTVTDLPVVFVDDLVNSGESFERQILALETNSVNLKIAGFFTIVHFRDHRHYRFLRHAKFESLFRLDELGLTMHWTTEDMPNTRLFNLQWKFQSPEPNHFYVVPKSGPVIDEERVYFGSDAGFFWAIDQKDGSPVWKFKVGKTANGKEIFSTAVLHGEMLYFGAYDGNFYALDSKTGSLRWRGRDAEWIGSSPAVAEDLGLVYVGVEHGLIYKRGGVIAYSLRDGAVRWHTRFSKEYVHASPAYSRRFGAMGIGSNDKRFYCLDAATGTIRWTFETEGEIKGQAVFDEKRGTVLFGSADGSLYILDANTGALRGKFRTENLVYTTPLLYGDSVLIGSEDKHLYRVNLDTGEAEWKFRTDGRILSSPLRVDTSIYIGSNDGRFYEIEGGTGKARGFFQALERITNRAAYNPRTRTFFVLTAANELLALARKEGEDIRHHDI
jgi:outer membrane protein assembly factor BamB/orotate phosphoribosyltransferase